MKCKFTLLAALALTALVGEATAQSVLTMPAGERGGMIAFGRDTVAVGYENEVRQISIMANAAYTIGAFDAPWLTVNRRADDRLVISTKYHSGFEPRYALVPFAVGDTIVNLTVMQEANTSAATIKGDTKLTISGGSASSAQTGEGFELSYDGNASTYYHSPWSAYSYMPVTLTYNLSGAPHVDYLIYTPRQSGTNGNFGQITIAYSTTAAPSTFTNVLSTDLGYSSSAAQISLGDNGLDNVASIRITVASGSGGFASCAEMAFYAYDNSTTEQFNRIFADNLRTTLREGLTEADIAGITEPLVKQLASAMYAGGYSTAYRVGTFEAYPKPATQIARYKTIGFNRYENPTGIYFTAGTPIVIFAEGIGSDAVGLIVKNFGSASNTTQEESSYPLKNGLNIITPSNRGNGYVSYYTDNASAPNVRLHFALANETGYFDLEAGDDNDKWQTLLANAKSDIMDVRAKRIQGAYPVDRLKAVCPTDGVQLLKNMDSTVYYSREVMGWLRYGIEPKNRQLSRVVYTGGMFADAIGAASNVNGITNWLVASTSTFDFWSYGHELGHNNQIRPDFLYAGCGETTNNIYSAWVQFKLSTANYWRLESEVTGLGEFASMRGGRFQCYFSNIIDGTPWQLVDGPDYNGTAYNTKTVKNENYEGTVLSQDTIVQTRNFDHFVKLAPLWQLQLYCEQAGFSPGVYGKVFETFRNTTLENTPASSGKYQLRFIKLVCDSTGMNFLPFFKKAGMLLPVNAYIEDYSPDWLKINEAMIAELEAYVASKGYPLPTGEPNYITALNWRTYAEQLPLGGADVNAGTSVVTDNKGTRIQVSHSTWQNVVAFETYDASDKLIRITMQGLGADANNSYTQVLFPTTASYIKAVGWDGTRTICYQR